MTEDQAFNQAMRSLSAALPAISMLRAKGDHSGALEIATQAAVVMTDLVNALQVDALGHRDSNVRVLPPLRIEYRHNNVIPLKPNTEEP